MTEDPSDVRMTILVVAPPGSVRDVRAILEALDRWRLEAGLYQVVVQRFEELRSSGTASLRDRLDAQVDVALAVFGRGAGSQGGGRVTEVVDTVHMLGKPVVLFRSTESLTDSDGGRSDPARMALLQRWLERARDRGIAVQDYRNVAELMDLAVLAADERVAAVVDERPTGPTRQEERTHRPAKATLRRQVSRSLPGPRPALPTDTGPIFPPPPPSRGVPLSLFLAAGAALVVLLISLAALLILAP